MLDDKLLEAFIKGFYGYGNYHAKYWFIGMEEGGGNKVSEIAKRLEIWDKRGRGELEDVSEYHREIGLARFFGEHPKLQPTWNKIIRVVLSTENPVVSIDDVREYQKSLLGKKRGETCLLELLPLPSPNTRAWLYGRNSKLSYLTDRETYREYVEHLRVAHLQSGIARYKPKVVTFYGLRYQEQWQKIAGIEFRSTKLNSASFNAKGQTLFILTKHPTAKGVTNEYFHQIGRLIAAQSRSQ